MAKIGTAHVEIKPVLNEEALVALVKRIEDAVEAGVSRAMADANKRVDKALNEAASDATRANTIRVWQDGRLTYEGPGNG